MPHPSAVADSREVMWVWSLSSPTLWGGCEPRVTDFHFNLSGAMAREIRFWVASESLDLDLKPIASFSFPETRGNLFLSFVFKLIVVEGLKLARETWWVHQKNGARREESVMTPCGVRKGKHQHPSDTWWPRMKLFIKRWKKLPWGKIQTRRCLVLTGIQTSEAC